jgi:hypothetical protein
LSSIREVTVRVVFTAGLTKQLDAVEIAVMTGNESMDSAVTPSGSLFL